MQRAMVSVMQLLLLAQAALGSRLRHPIIGQSKPSLGLHSGNMSGAVGLRLNATSSAYGKGACPCVGIDGIAGETTVHIGKDAKAPYPADLGARCKAWDDGRDPKSCQEGGNPGKGKGWCAERWCYVDPCNCDLPTLPKPASYLPGAEFKGRPVYYSYVTCGGTDTWSDGSNKKSKAEVKSVCSKKAEEAAWGEEECRCVGIANQPGRTDVTIGDKVVGYAADAGSKCGAWDSKKHPECGGKGKQPDWCGKSWCYVDPCSCKLKTPPKASSYLPGSTFQGRPLYYSYATCGHTDTWASKAKAASSAPLSLCESEGTPSGPGTEYNKSAYAKDWHDEYKNGDFPNWKETTRGVEADSK